MNLFLKMTNLEYLAKKKQRPRKKTPSLIAKTFIDDALNHPGIEMNVRHSSDNPKIVYLAIVGLIQVKNYIEEKEYIAKLNDYSIVFTNGSRIFYEKARRFPY